MTIYKYFSQHSGFFILPFVIVPLGIHFLIKQILLLKPKIKHFIDTDLEYYNKKKSRFIDTYKDSIIKYNLNIETIFYRKAMLEELMKDNSNYLEKKWKSKVLIETTPRGNIIMFYNPYKLGFSYYSDSTGIPYPILNAVAMKYVTVFYCRDFFVDEHFVKTVKNSGAFIFDSPLLPIYFIEPKPITTSKKQTTNTVGPFAKLKNYKPNQFVATKIAQKPVDYSLFTLFYNKLISFFNIKKKPIIYKKKVEEPEKEYNFNRFIRAGYMKDFKPLNVIKDFSKVNGFQSNLLENLASETKLQKQVMSYKDYKFMK